MSSPIIDVQLDHLDLLRAELIHLRAVETAAADLVRKLDEHETRGYSHIRLGALRPLRDALGGAR